MINELYAFFGCDLISRLVTIFSLYITFDGMDELL